MYRILVVEDDAGIAQAICKQAAMWDLRQNMSVISGM